MPGIYTLKFFPNNFSGFPLQRPEFLETSPILRGVPDFSPRVVVGQKMLKLPNSGISPPCTVKTCQVAFSLVAFPLSQEHGNKSSSKHDVGSNMYTVSPRKDNIIVLSSVMFGLSLITLRSRQLSAKNMHARTRRWEKPARPIRDWRHEGPQNFGAITS